MKKLFLSLTAALVIAGVVSCNKNAVTPSAPEVPAAPQGALTVNIGIPAQETKVPADASHVKDFAISSVQVVVFDHSAGLNDGSDLLETDYYYEPDMPVNNSVSVTLNTKTGAKIIYVIVNRDQQNYVARCSNLLQFERELVELVENGPARLVMVGKGAITVEAYDRNKNPSQTAQPLSIWVRRQAAMVKLSSVKFDFTNSSLHGANARISGIYLKNVVGVCRMALDGNTDSATAQSGVHFLPLSDTDHATANYWYSKYTYDEDSPEILSDMPITADCDTDGTVKQLNRCYFVYPNKTAVQDDIHGETTPWTPRLTRLTVSVRVTLNDSPRQFDKTTYYTFDLPVLESNKVYDIQNITITQLGKDNDDTDTADSAGKITPAITVAPWDSDVINLNYEF